MFCLCFELGSGVAKARAQDVLLVSKATKKTLELFKSGASLERRTGYEISILVSKATLDRLELSRRLCRAAEAATSGRRCSYRSATSRAYYSMYHALRATAFLPTKATITRSIPSCHRASQPTSRTGNTGRTISRMPDTNAIEPITTRILKMT